MANRITVSLDPEHAEKLSRLAARMNVEEGALATVLLSNALDDADPAAAHMVRLLDGVPGAYARTRDGIEQSRRGEGVTLDDIA